MKYIDETLDLQREFFKTGKTMDLDFRLDNLRNLREVLRENEGEILEALYLDLNKSPFEAYSAELGLILDELGFAIKNLRKWSRPKRVKTNLINFKSKSYTIREPYGNTLIMSPWNYPLLLSISPMIASISGGNTILVKPSEHSPHTSKLLEKLINSSFPRNYIHLINGELETSKYILTKKFDYIFYTGSGQVGRMVMKSAADHLTPLTLELGGKSPCIVDSRAKLELAARRIVWGKFLNAGQTCVAPDYILVDNKVKEELTGYLIHYINHNVLKAKEDYPKIINERHFSRLLAYKKDQAIIYDAGQDKEALKIYPSLIDQPDPTSPLMQEEIFGPILPIIGYSNLEEAIDLVRSKDKPLALYIFSEDQKVIDRLIGSLSFGGGAINDTVMQLSNPHLPFGGVGPSGMGNYHGEYGFKTFSHEKAILHKSTRLDLPVRYQPYGDKLKLIKKILN